MSAFLASPNHSPESNSERSEGKATKVKGLSPQPAKTVESRMIAGERRETEIATTAIPIAPLKLECTLVLVLWGLYVMSGRCISHPLFLLHKPNHQKCIEENINKCRKRETFPYAS